MKRALLITLMALIPSVALAEQSSRCTDISAAKEMVAAHGGRWIELTNEQWQFLRGVFVVNPETPAGLPYGNKAVLAQMKGESDGLILFIDGSRACTPMHAPGVLLDLMRDVATTTITHEADKAQDN